MNTCEGMWPPPSSIVLDGLPIVEKLLLGGIVVCCGRADSTVHEWLTIFGTCPLIIKYPLLSCVGQESQLESQGFLLHCSMPLRDFRCGLSPKAPENGNELALKLNRPVITPTVAGVE